MSHLHSHNILSYGQSLEPRASQVLLPVPQTFILIYIFMCIELTFDSFDILIENVHFIISCLPNLFRLFHAPSLRCCTISLAWRKSTTHLS